MGILYTTTVHLRIIYLPSRNMVVRGDRAGDDIYLSTSAVQAGRWGEMKYPGKSISVVKMDLGKSVHNIKGGNRNWRDNEYSHAGNIPAHFIRGVVKHNIGD
jgi:hypothetical protein